MGALEMPGINMRHRGFTLIELMVALVVLAVLASIALPSFRTFIGEQRLKAASFELQSALLLARSEAIKRGMAGSVAVSAADNKNWAAGWTIAAGAQTLARQGSFEQVLIVESADAPSVTYTGEGRVAAPVAFTLSVPSDSKVVGRCVRVDTSGMPYSKLLAGGACS